MIAKMSLKENKMGVMPVGRLLLGMALPMALSMLVQALYNVVDSMFVSRISDLNNDALNAVSLAFPVQNIMIGIATGVAVGVNALLSRGLGEKNMKEVNSSALNNPQLIRDCAQKLGSQCVVLAVDAKKEADGSWHVYLAGGRKDTGRDLLDWVQEAVQLGAGEILLTSMDKDGTKSGFDLPMLQAVAEVVSVPIIASGGAGSLEHMVQVFQETPVTGALAASIFHYGEVSIKETKEAMVQAGLEARL